jgi:1-acyl-sn-glycerol-3-phosphate acyltransferase
MRKQLATFIYFKVLGWQVEGHFQELKRLPKAIIIAVPHTSWHDFYVGVLVRAILDIKISFIGKKALFTFPFGYFFRALGGQPIDRHSNNNVVKSIAKLFYNTTTFRLALAPEGTRKKVDKWRTGFYYIAKTAKVPIVMFALDFEHKKTCFSTPFNVTDDIDADLKVLKSFFKGVKGKIPHYS